MDTSKMDRLQKREADKAARIIANESFQERVAALRQSGFSRSSDKKSKKELEKLTADFCPNVRWSSGVRAYVLTDNADLLKPDLPGPRIRIRYNAKGKREGVDLELDPHTTREDLEAIWPYAKNVLRTIKDVPIKSQPYHSIQRDSEIAELKYKKHMSNADIAKHMAKKGYQITPEYISTILKRRKDKIDTSSPD